MSKYIGTIKVIDIKQHKDGTATVQFEVSKEIKKVVREYYKKKRCTTKLFKQFIIEGIINHVAGELKEDLLRYDHIKEKKK